MAIPDIEAALDQQEWLGPAEVKLQQAVHDAFTAAGEAGQQAANFLHGTWLGEPLHVVLTDIPIGAWTTAVVFDILELVSNSKAFAKAADTSVMVGLVGVVGAAVTGVTDWQDVDPPARRLGLVHGMLNLCGAGLFAASYIMRRKKERGTGRALAALGYIVAGVSAHLGGKLVYEHRIGVDHSPSQKISHFVAVLPEAELGEGAAKRVEQDGIPILLVRKGSNICALADTCSHLGGPLSEGQVDESSVTCPWHGSRFSLEGGSVLDGPAVHPQPCYEVRISTGQIELRSQGQKN